MPGGYGNITGKDGNGFDKNPHNINRKGRTPGLKAQLAKVAMADGWLTFKHKDVIIEDDYIKVKVPKEEAMALKFFQIAMGKNPSAALKAITTYLEVFDGKAVQALIVEKREPRNIGYGPDPDDDEEE